MRTTRGPWVPCPYCAAPLDAATNFTGDGGPKPGDVSLCFTCSGLLVFGRDLKPVKPTPAELIDIQRAPEWPTIERLARAIKARKV
jgi:hypothetical protein